MLKGNSVFLVLAATLLMFAPLSQAQNIGSELGKSEYEDEDSGGYFQIGFGGGWADRPLEDDYEDFGGLVIEGRYAWNGLFVELDSDSVGVPGFAVGYELWEDNQWAVDLVAIPFGGLDPKNTDRLKQSNLGKRSAFTLTGIRATRFFNDFILQGHILPLGEGSMASLAIGKFWQVKNWNLTATAALRYNSQAFNDDIWSITPEEASIEFPQYSASSSLAAIFVLRAEYPISENWVFETSVFANGVSDGIADSPIVARDKVRGVAFEISYVF